MRFQDTAFYLHVRWRVRESVSAILPPHRTNDVHGHPRAHEEAGAAKGPKQPVGAVRRVVAVAVGPDPSVVVVVSLRKSGNGARVREVGAAALGRQPVVRQILFLRRLGGEGGARNQPGKPHE